ncbi:MAG: type II secretion system F family protein [Novosphingobium sp.]|nr:type II secretion system F family protein [Novosphingobium sp.]
MYDVLIRVVVMLAVFASVFLIAQVVISYADRNRARLTAINTRLRMVREGRSREEVMAHLRKNEPSEFAHLPPLLAKSLQSFQRMMMAAAVPFTPTQGLVGIFGLFILLCAIMLFGASAAGFRFTSGTILLILAVGFCAAVVIPVLIVSMIAQRRRKRIETQFPISLDIFVRALRSGHPIAAAIDLLTKEMEDPIGSEFGLVADEVSYGADLRDALEGMAERWNLDDMRMFVVSLSVQSETGGNLAEILENLSKVIRDRAAMYMKVRALSSEGRMTGWMLTALPIFAFVLLFSINPSFYLNVAQDPIFTYGFIGLMLLYTVGVLTIRKMIDLKV